MPGLVGIIGLGNNKVNSSLMTAMRDVIRHRGWYVVDDSINVQETAAISRIHLGIINQEKQPYLAPGGRIKIFLHGEIYNDEAIRGNPLDFIFRLYQKEGPNFASFLNGSFIVVIMDEVADVILIANDRLAAKPLFYYRDHQALYFGPEMKSLLLVPSLKRELHPAAIADFLANGYFTRNYTLIKGLETLESATVLQIRTRGITHHKYWEYDLEQGYSDRGTAYYQERLAALLRQAVRRRLHVDKTYGILLSGGYDSRGILGCYLEAKGSGGLHTISWGQKEDIPSSDCAIAKKLAHQLGADHGFYELDEEVIDHFRDFIWLGEGLTWYPESYDVFHRIREQQAVEIVLRGDECFGWEGLMVHDEQTMLRSLYIHALQDIRTYQRVLKPSYYQSLCDLSRQMLRDLSAGCPAKDLHNRKDFFYLDVRLKHFLNPLNSVKTLAVESLTPLLDYEILDFVSRLPVSYRLSKSLYRKTVVTMFPELFEEFAQRRNDIDWPKWFRNSPSLKLLLYRELMDPHNVLSEYVDVAGLRNELERVTSSEPSTASKTPRLRDPMKAGATWLRETSPAVFDLAHKSMYYARRRLGRPNDVLAPDRAILRLLILKIWVDIFMNYPTHQSSSEAC